jgi:hypothetical protein
VDYHRVKSGSGGGGETKRRIPYHCATWLGRGRVAVSGDTVEVIDTRTWRARRPEPRADQAHLAGGRLLLFRSRYSEDPGRGIGLAVYERSGRHRVAHRFGDQLLNVQVAGGYAYDVAGRRVRIVHARSGRLVDEARRGRHGFTVLLDSRAGSSRCIV